MLVFKYQLLQNIAFMLFITKLTSAIIKQKIDAIIRNFYLKLSINNISLSIFDKFFLEKIDSNIKTNVFLFQSFIKKVLGIKKINAINLQIDIFTITTLAINNRKNHHFQNS